MDTVLQAYTWSNIDQFSTFFTFRIRRKFALVLQYLKIPPHLDCVATLWMSLF